MTASCSPFPRGHGVSDAVGRWLILGHLETGSKLFGRLFL